jgi:nitrogen regulatory protein PII 1
VKLIRAVIRPEREAATVSSLEAAGIVALTKMEVLGRGQQGGVQVGGVKYDDLPKVMFWIVVEDAQVEAALDAIRAGARTGQYGDGLVTVSPVEAVHRIRTPSC